MFRSPHLFRITLFGHEIAACGVQRNDLLVDAVLELISARVLCREVMSLTLPHASARRGAQLKLSNPARFSAAPPIGRRRRQQLPQGLG